jgi:hypothetical protein
MSICILVGACGAGHQDSPDEPARVQIGGSPRSGGTDEQSRKVAAIFDIKKVFDPSSDLDRLIAGAQLDRHPFKYDPRRATPGEQQRWLIVERHMEKTRGRPKK